VATEHTATQARPTGRVPRPARRATGPALRFTGFLKRSWPSLVTVVALLVIWQVIVDARHVSAFTLPSPSEIWQYITQNAGSLRQDTQTTLQETLVAYALSVVIGIPFGFLTYRSRIFARVIYPLLLGSQTFPKVAVGPLFVVWFGFGQFPIVLLALLLTFFPITLNTVAGLRSVEPESVELGKIIGLRWYESIFKIDLPQALPSIFAGLRLATSLAVIGAVVGEFLGTSSGLGYRIVNATGNADTVELFACLVILTVMGLIFYAVVAAIESILVPWRNREQDDISLPQATL
jgi:NitT/TauT family transport system permease protein